MKRFLAMFSFSFLIVGFVLAYYTYQALSGKLPAAQWQTAIYAAGSACSIALGFLGVRERHRKSDG